MRRSRGLRWLLAAVTGLVACSAPPALEVTPGDEAGDATVNEEGSLATDPPPVLVTSGEESLELASHHHCYGSACVSGMPPEELPDVGAADELEVAFPLSGWSFSATFTPSGSECGRVQGPVPLESRDDGSFTLAPAGPADSSFTLAPAGPADTYDVTLRGQHDADDLVVAFTWTTSRDGPPPRPEARVSVLAANRGEVDSYGVELSVRNLAETPAEAAATITVTGPNDQAVAFTPTRVADVCEQGALRWEGPDERGRAAAALDDAGPFTYEVDLLLDGVRHVAVATWPDDEIDGLDPYVALEFDPPLPALDVDGGPRR